MSDRVFAYAVSIALLGAMAWPAFRDPPRDSFPLSNYPMFSRARPDARITLTQAVGRREDGSQATLSPALAADNEEVLQAMVLIRNAVRAGPTRLREFCDAAAERVAADPDLKDVVAVEIATVDHDALAYFEDGYQPLARRVHGRCEVPR